MNAPKWILRSLLALALGSFGTTLMAHGTEGEPLGPPEGMIVTRHFTGIWNQPDQESHGLALQVVEQNDGSRRAVAFWYAYGADRQSAWFMAIGDLVDNRIEMELFEAADIGFMQADEPGNESVQPIGTMTLTFDDCHVGEASFATDHPVIGSGSFRIERLLEVMNTHCSGGISDDMHADGLFGQQRLGLHAARQGFAGGGHARYEDYPGHMEFEVELEGVPDGMYGLYVGGEHRGDFLVHDGHGELRFTSPGEEGYRLLNFDPRGMPIEVRDGEGVVLSAFEARFQEHYHTMGDGEHYGQGGHRYLCDDDGHMGGGHMGGGRADCVEDGDWLEIEIDLTNTGMLAQARGEAEWAMNEYRALFSVAIEGVPAGDYPVRVGGVEVGVIEAFERMDGEVYGRLGWRDPEVYGRAPLDFDPRGRRIEVLQGDTVILEADFPPE